MRKILFCVTYYYPHISGLTNSVKNIAELLVKNNFAISVLAARHSDSLSSSEDINKVKVVRVPYLFKISKGFFMPLFLFFSLKEIIKSDQVVVFLPQFEGFIIAILAKVMSKKIHGVYTCEVVRPRNVSGKIITLLLQLSHWITLFLADNLISLTEDFAQNNKQLLRYSKKLQIIYPLISPQAINNNEVSSLRKKIKFKKNLIGFVGRISEEKGIQYLIETIPLLQKEFKNNFGIVLVGPIHVVGEKKYAQKINRLISKYKKNIIYLGELSEEQLRAFYSIIDVLVLPSVSSTEAFGMVQVEAMLCGAPVVASDLPGVRVPVRLTKMGEITKVKDVSDLAEKITKVIRNKKNYIKDAKEIIKVFSTEESLDKYKKFFSEPF
ncbi:glycosyltransferase family 4 protein [Candidatus Roizmanbacteria bacterium]|nr:glycosyltransferase family 4 protein [Candidatus Roizmanbacteria bacterium]